MAEHLTVLELEITARCQCRPAAQDRAVRLRDIARRSEGRGADRHSQGSSFAPRGRGDTCSAHADRRLPRCRIETAADHSGSGPSPHVGTMNCALCARQFPVHGVPCAGTRIRLPIHLIPRATYGRVLWTGRRPCPECATSPGSPHHMPCDREYCPACVDGQRLTSCLDHFLWTALPSPAGRGTASRAPQPPPVWQPGQK
jgi:hypothetical protein